MKKLFTALCLFVLMTTSANLIAQEITITLNPGCTWISYTRADTLKFAEALGYFNPMEGDVIKSQRGNASYNNGRWKGNLQQFTPGLGYMYISMRTEPVSFIYTHAYQPEVSTGEVTGITTTSATVGVNFVNDGGATMNRCGICWGTNENPTINNNVALIGELTPSEYALDLTNLIPGTTYHARAFATNSVGTSYGEDVSFTTQFVLPTVTTNEASWVTTTTAIVGGQFSFVGNCFVTECGVCYRTGEGTETCIAVDATNNSFSTTLEDLMPNTTYIVRAYATNGAGTAYGEEKTFTTLEEPPAFPNGAIDSKFTVNAFGGQVYFSQGNLQYIGSAAEPYWKFADYQWYRFGETTGQNSTNENVDRDLFGWGTSGYDHGANCYQPWSTSTSYTDYYAYGQSNNDLNDGDGRADWGYNAIANGGNEENSGWRTLTKDEWYYVFNTRTDAVSKYGHGCVNGVNGMVLLPDEWTLPEGLSFTSGNSNWANVYTAEQWVQMEANGAVFLPVAGYRRGTSLNIVDSRGFYWTSSYNNQKVYNVDFYSSSLNSQNSDNRYDGSLVRLVRNTVIVPPSVTTHNVTSITNTTAIVGGQITDYGGVVVTEYGICYSTEQSEETCVAIDEIYNHTFLTILQDLTPNTTYYVRAYAINEAGTSYGEEVSFTTLNEGEEHAYVDLGLPSGLLWATCNVGAETPEECGNYFAWGETTPKNVYNWSTYLYCNGSSSTLTKYTGSDGLTILLPEDDAATANWGNGWRMPTTEEWQELYQSTTHTWTIQNGVQGRLYTASNGNSIFLPAVGYFDGSNLYEGGSCGSYWSSSLRISQYAWDYYFGSGHSYMGYGGYRFCGEPVRPVRSAE